MRRQPARTWIRPVTAGEVQRGDSILIGRREVLVVSAEGGWYYDAKGHPAEGVVIIWQAGTARGQIGRKAAEVLDAGTAEPPVTRRAA